MLAYVFVHRPDDGVSAADYVGRLRTFHEALAARPPSGFHRSWVWEVDAGPLGDAFEDWYLVEDWEALGVLNDAAVRGRAGVAHDWVAPLSGRGTGAVYRLLHGTPAPTHTRRMRVSKPSGVSYPAFEAQLRQAADATVIWKRQMVLGPDAEFLIDVAEGPLSRAGADERETLPFSPDLARAGRLTVVHPVEQPIPRTTHHAR